MALYYIYFFKADIYKNKYMIQKHKKSNTKKVCQTAGENMGIKTGTDTTAYTAADLIRQKKEEIYKKVTTGKTEEKIQTGGTAFSKKEWEKLIGRVDKVEDKAKEDIEEKKKQEVDKSLNERNAAYGKMSVKASVTKEKTVKSKQDVLELL